MSETLIVGLDAGGTKTAALAAFGGRTERLAGPAAQVLRDGIGPAAETVVALAEEARSAFDGVALGAVAVGIAGAGTEATRVALAAAIRQRLPGVGVAVVHDAEIAYRATWGDGSGALLLVGTGSLLYAKTEAGTALRAGGWGGRLGDDGSGTALGRAALRALLAALDGGPPSALPDLAAESHGLGSQADVFQAVYTDRQPLAEFAPLLLAAVEGGDWSAEAALRSEVNALAKQAGWLATRAGAEVTPRLRYAGGLAGEPVYRTALDAALERHLPGWSVGPSEAEPVEGALALAREL